MENIYTTKIIKIGTSKGVVIPLDILNALNWQRGDSVIFTLAADDHLIIKKLNDETLRRLKNLNGQIEGDENTIQID